MGTTPLWHFKIETIGAFEAFCCVRILVCGRTTVYP